MFWDFFIGDAFGSELIEDLKSGFAKDDFSVADSSTTEANTGMVEAGAFEVLST